MKIIEVKSKKIECISEMVEDMLNIGGKLMSCLENLSEESMYERKPMMRDTRYSKPMDEKDEDMYERRRRY